MRVRYTQFWRLLLAPLSIVYGLVILIRNGLYSAGVLKETKFQLPIINVGNLSLGGTGKTPHIDYLIKLLKDYVDVATLSRGYGRDTSGFRVVSTEDLPTTTGDEPLLIKMKHPDIGVYVGEDRVLSVPSILKQSPDTQVILLDDAFQHRAIRAGLNLILTPCEDLFVDDYLLPMGRLREFPNGRQRADAIIVTKCPYDLSDGQKEIISARLRGGIDIPVFFSHIVYGNPYSPFDTYRNALTSDTDIILLSAIANNQLLLNHLEDSYGHVKSISFRDHYHFTKNDIANLVNRYEQLDSDNKVVITTEKDLMRLLAHRDYIVQAALPLFVLPIDIAFFDSSPSFDQFIRDFLLNFKV